MREKVYCQCSNCKNREHHTIIAGMCIQWEMPIKVCKNSREISVFHMASNTLRRTCANYMPKEVEVDE